MLNWAQCRSSVLPVTTPELENSDMWTCGHVYRSAGFVVVAVHRRACIRAILPGVGELPGHQHPELSVLAAAAPLPALPGWTFVVGVATAHGGRALGAGARHCVRHACGSNGVDESRLPSG